MKKIPTQNVYFTNDDYAWIAYYAMENNLTVTDVVKLVVETGISTLKQKALEKSEETKQ